MVSDPFSDNVPNGQLVIPRGSYEFLKVALEVGSNLTSPDADWLTAVATVRSIKDPDGTDVTSSWATVALDPDDPTDTYDASNATYVGDTVTPEKVGLFSDGAGRIAQKVQVPSNAEVTTSNSLRAFTVTWNIKKNGNTVTSTETFNIGPAGVLVFLLDMVTVAEVTQGIKTQLSDADVTNLITEATNWADGMLDSFDIDSATLTELPKLVRLAIINYARMLVFDYDASAFRKMSNVREGDVAIGYSGNSRRDAESLLARAQDLMETYGRRHSPLKKGRMKVNRQTPYQGRFRFPY